ncbi:MAG: aldehyde ferredoxin oxidoreductase family protein [Negativicutes bacterium]|nr:aldehyde ferredoxin oxidoreductase family protein [Negativicutes bacterium]
MYGFAGTLLDINLTTRTVGRAKLTDDQVKSLGGIGISTRVVAEYVPADADALSPANVLCFAVGAFAGTHIPAACRTEVSAKSPATGLFGTANSGAYWGSELKFAGYDGVIIRGRAEQPVYILIRDSEVAIVPADELKGKDSWETIKTIRKEWADQEIQVAAIGPAGENLCRFASIQNGPYDAWGRTGLGAVMGSKNLKAIAVRGSGAVRVADKQKLLTAERRCREAIYNSPFFASFARFGTMLATVPYYEFGALPGRNFQQGQVDNWLETRSRKLVPQYSKRGIACISCPIACAHWVEIREGPYRGLELKDMEVTPLIGFGAGCDIENIPAIAKLTEMCQRYGVDMVSAAGTIAFALELFEKGLITVADIGFPLAWGDTEAVLALLAMIARREGFGNLLAEGTMRAGEAIHGASRYAMHIKGLEIPMADPRGRWSTWTFGNLTNIRGGDHLRCRNPVENLRFNAGPVEYRYEKFGLGAELLANLDMPPNVKSEIFSGDQDVDIPRMAKWAEDLITVFNSVGLCIRPPVLQAIGPSVIAQLFTALTGVEKTAAEIMAAGERTWNLQKLFNLKCGESGDRSVYPDRFYQEVLQRSPSARKLERSKVQAMLEEYYAARGWSKLGIPTESKLKELGLAVKE